MILTLAFWRGAAERAIKTFAQALASAFIVTAPIVEQPWLVALGLAGTAATLSLLTSIFNADFTAGTSSADDT